MDRGVSLFLMALGAILYLAVTETFEGINLNMTGLILFFVGGLGLLWSLLVDRRDV